MFLHKAYYTFKFLIPRRLQLALRRNLVRRKLPKYAEIWPIDKNSGTLPERWTCWPNGKKFALALTHDVEKRESLDKCYQLAEIEERLGFRSSFNFVPGDYSVPEALHQYLIDHGFEIAIHGLHHNNNPFRSESVFRKQSAKINNYLKAKGCVGFRAPSMYHDLELIHHLDIEYDASTFDTDPFEPQSDGVGTIFPFWVPNQDPRKGYVELPYTLPQDFLLFILLQEKNIDIWKKKLDWIADRGGMALFISHPDYMNFTGFAGYDEYPAKYYEEFLEHIKAKYEGRYWHALPRDISGFWSGKYKSPGSSIRSQIHPPLPLETLSAPSHERSTVSKAIIIDPINDSRWDRFVAGHPFGLIYHISGWKQVLEESFSHMKGHYLALLNRDNDSIRAALPVFEVRSIFTGNRLVSVPFATICDPLISSNEDMTALLDAAIDLSTKLGCSKIEIRTLASTPLIDDGRIGSVVHHKCHQLSLEVGPGEIIKKYRRQFRQQINKSMKSGLDLQIAKDEGELKEFYRLYVRNRGSLGLPPQPYLFFQSLWQTFLSSKHITLLLVRYEGQLVAGLMMFKFKDRCSCEYMALKESMNNLNTRHFIFWEAIKSAFSEGFKMFDFGRTGINNEGLMVYKSHWGTEAVDLPQFYYPKEISSHLIPPDLSISYKLIRKISKTVPDSLLQCIGNFMYRHLG